MKHGPSFGAFFRDVESEAYWRSIAPWLHIGAAAAAPRTAPRRSEPVGPTGPEPRWPESGYARLDDVLDAETAARLAKALTELHARALHPTFVYVYDETWAVLDALLPRLRPLLGDDLDILADVWAWYVDPRTQRGGWPLHRGWYEDVRGSSGEPGLVNVWISLTHATEQNACMHLVPLPRDPHYPDDLHDVTGVEPLGIALQTRAGSALAWNANVAHWGGACDPSFTEPRMSMSFTLRRRSYPPPFASVRPPLTFRARLDLVADQFETYGKKEMAPERLEMQWASVVAGMRRVARSP